MEISTLHNFFNQSQYIYEILNELLSALRGRKYFFRDAFYIIHLIMYGKNLVDKCKNYLKIPMTGLFAWHGSIHDFGRYQFYQWNVLFQKMIWNIYHHWNHAWFGLAAYFCCHALPWLILKKREIFQTGFYFLKLLWTFWSTNKALTLTNFSISDHSIPLHSHMYAFDILIQGVPHLHENH